MRLISMLCSVMAAPLLVAASEPVRLQPSTQWVVDYAEDSCRLGRIFGTGRDETKLVLESIGHGAMTMAATGRLVSASPDELNVGARFLPLQAKPFFGVPGRVAGVHAVIWTFVPLAAQFEHDNRRVPGALLMVTGGKPTYPRRPDLKHALIEQEASKGTPEFFSKTTEIEIKVPRERTVILETGSLAEPMKAFSTCEHDLVKSLGLDPEVQDRVARPPWPLSLWLARIAFPERVITTPEEGSVQVRAIIDANGGVTACTVQTQWAPEFKDQICEGLRKYGRFAPAELADGTKVAAIYTTRVDFRVTY
jgi:hypothetical protein